MHPCEKCGEPVEDQYRLCYVCMRREQEVKAAARKYAAGSVVGPSSGQTLQNPYYTHPKYETAPERKETTYDARQEAITKAHQDNMLANQMLVDAILKLVGAVEELCVNQTNNTTAMVEAVRGATP